MVPTAIPAMSYENVGINGAIHMQEARSETTAHSPMPIAIVGLSCKYAGDATNPDRLWQLCSQGKSAWSEIPPDRFNQKAFHHPSGENQITSNIAGGYFFKHDVSFFDGSFFNMSSDVANTMDPQCRLQLESVFEALESAGIPIEKIAGTATSVFAGLFFRDYQDSFMRDPEAYPRQVVTGNGATMMSNRISHFFDLRGPSMTIDTACSTALVALHMACQSLRSGESKISIVGGVNAMLNPDNFILLSSLGFLSPDGKCYAFDDRASGYGRGEGVGTLIIKPLADALRDGDPVRAVIRGTAVNQNGKTQTITSPSVDAQESVIRACYQNAGLDPSRTGYVEAHGTGTQAGDPVEVEGIARVFMPGRPLEEVLHIGSVKTNIGHTEAASGLASIIKMVYALEHGVIPPSINLEVPNEKVKLKERRFEVPRRLISWPAGYDKRVSVNNFGYGGTNAHVILESANPSGHAPLQNGALVNRKPRNGRNRRRTLIFSGKDESATERMIPDLRDYLHTTLYHGRDEDHQLLDDLAYTLCQRRSIFTWSIAMSATNLQELTELLQTTSLKPARSSDHLRLGFVFTGQGAQWYAMGRELISEYPVFEESLLEADDHLRDFGCQWSLMDELTKDAAVSRINDVKISPPLCIALQISLVRLLRSWGIKPVAVTGHSSGEVAAAFAANVIDYRSALAIVYSRGVLTTAQTQEKTGRGAMMAAGLGRQDAERHISTISSGKVVVACVNSPSSVTISGDYVAVEELREKLQAQNVFTRRLNVNAAFHSHHMQPIAKDYRSFLERTLKKAGDFDGIVYSSPVTGTRVAKAGAIATPEHWVKNMLQPVEFSDCFWNLCFDKTGRQTVDTVIEIGPHGALAGPMRQILAQPQAKHNNVSITTCLTRNENAVQTMHAMVSHLVTKGYRPDMGAVNFPRKDSQVKVLYDLPAYPWSHKVKHWSESRMNKLHRLKRAPAHDLLGSVALGSNPAFPTWRRILRAADLPWVCDHRVQGDILYPAAGFCCMAIEAISQLNRERGRSISRYKLQRVEVISALVIPDSSDGVEVQLSLLPTSEKGKEGHAFRVFSVLLDNRWTEHCSGYISVDLEEQAAPAAHGSRATIFQSLGYTRRVDPADLFKTLRLGGITHGKIFQNLDSIESCKNNSKAVFHVANTALIMPRQYQSKHVIHPTTLDSIIVAAYSTFSNTRIERDGVKVPRLIQELSLSADIKAEPGYGLVAYSSLQKYDQHAFEASVTVASLTDKSDGPLVELKGLTCQSLRLGEDGKRGTKKWCSTLEWQPDVTSMSHSSLRAFLQMSLSLPEARTLVDIRQACFHVMQGAIQALNKHDLETLEPHYKRLFHWMSSRLEESDTQLDLNRRSSDDERNLLERVKDTSAHGRVIYHLASKLPEVIRGELNPLSLLLETHFFDNVLRWDRSYQQIGKLVGTYSHKFPRALFLEVGAGTGACTQSVLEALGRPSESQHPRFASYDFTDVSSGFFEGARERFADWGDLIRYKRFDADANPDEQGIEHGSYDVIIASHVIHATKNITRTLGYLNKMLKPGGKLIVAETTCDRPENGLVFGMLPGWWLGEEDDRKLSPTISAASWEQCLVRTGFEGLDVEVRDCDDDEHYSASVMMATAKVQEESPVYPEAVLVLDPSPVQSSWLDNLGQAISKLTSQRPEISSLSDVNARNKICIFLDEIFYPLLANMEEPQFDAIKSIVSSAKGVLWVSLGGSIHCSKPHVALHGGLLRVLRCENYNKKIISLDLDPDRDPCTKTCVDAISSLFRDTFNETLNKNFIDTEYAERGGIMHISRVYHSVNDNKLMDSDPWEEPSSLQPFDQSGGKISLNIGLTQLDKAAFTSEPEHVGSSANTFLAADSVEILPKAFGVDCREISRAMGRDDGLMAVECSGVITKTGKNVQGDFSIGERVCALFEGQIGNRVCAQATGVVAIPEDITFESAASLPLAFTTAYYSLHEVARLRKGERIVIHGGATVVGQAALQLAKLIGADIFSSVESEQEKGALIKDYALEYDHIFLATDQAMAEKVRRTFNSQNIDVVMTCATSGPDPLLLEYMAPFGRYINLGEREEAGIITGDGVVPSNLAFFNVDMLAIAKYKGQVFLRIFAETMQLFQHEKIKPIQPLHASPMSEIQETLQRAVTEKNVGKTIIVPTMADQVYVRLGSHAAEFSADATYLVIGGFGGIGQLVCRWMAERGARNLMLLSRNAERSRQTAVNFLEELEKLHCKVSTESCDVSDRSSLQRVIARAGRVLPPIRGVIHSAMVLRDSIFDRMSFADWETTTNAKVRGTWNLHVALLEHSLDFFIILSSIVGVAGNIGQANYAAGGSFQDALARHRSSKGLPCVSIDLGAVKSVGYLADESSKHLADRFTRLGFDMMDENAVLRVIESAILSPVRDPAFSHIIVGAPTRWGSHTEDTAWSHDMRFTSLGEMEFTATETRSNADHGSNLKARLSESKTLEDTIKIISTSLIKRLSEIFMTPESEMDADAPLASFGVDSLVAVELRSWIASTFEIDMSMFEVLQSASVIALSGKIAGKQQQESS